ncbi:hypothetical protein [Terricaulis sp.]|uniref:hypothetical protein n=1 Tax=Terricaulis sp. TaxID=2768686 RepID=UPI00378531D5
MSKVSLNHSMATLVACLALVACGPTATETATTPTEEVQIAGPQNVGDCVETTVTLVGPRLEGVPDSGSSIMYDNGLSQVEYDVIPGIANSHIGDAVRVCLVSVPEDCPPGDTRGRVYEGTNLRTNETWTAPDSQHSCGGA